MADKLLGQICELYRKTGSLKKTAEELGCAYAKVRKALISYGAYSTPFSGEAYTLRCKGYTVAEIAVKLNTTEKRVSAWLPYEKGIYNRSEKSHDAVRSSNYRNRNENAREHLVLNKQMKYSGEDKKMKTQQLPAARAIESEKTAPEKAAEPIRLHLRLHSEYLSEDEQRILKTYGRSTTGNTIERDILIPPDITLHALHYAILRLYGWQNGHLHSFRLPDEDYIRLTGNTVRGWGNLIGILFQTVYPDNEWVERYADDDYEQGSIKTWLRKKYTGPYRYLGWYEQYGIAVAEFLDFADRWQRMPVYEPRNINNKDMDREGRLIRYAPLIDVTLDEMNETMSVDCTDELLERLTVSSVLAHKGMKTAGSDRLGRKMIKRSYRTYGKVEEPEVKPVTHKLLYHYDYGDGWVVEITRQKDCSDMLRKGLITQDELSEASNTVIEKHRPVCIHQDGMCLVDDVGGFSGFVHMLRILYETNCGYDDGESFSRYDTDTKENMLMWASGMGWSARRISNKQML